MQRILAIGSSIMEAWKDFTSLFPGYEVLNKAVGGTQTTDWLEKAGREVAENNPDVIVCYVGSNDMFDRPAETIAANVKTIFQSCCPAGSKKLFIYLSILRAPQKEPVMDKVRLANSLIQSYQDASPNFRFIDINPAVFGANGKPVLAYYQPDLLHYTENGYEAMSRFAGPLIRRTVEEWLAVSPGR